MFNSWFIFFSCGVWTCLKSKEFHIVISEKSSHLCYFNMWLTHGHDGWRQTLKKESASHFLLVSNWFHLQYKMHLNNLHWDLQQSCCILFQRCSVLTRCFYFPFLTEALCFCRFSHVWDISGEVKPPTLHILKKWQHFNAMEWTLLPPCVKYVVVKVSIKLSTLLFWVRKWSQFCSSGKEDKYKY